MNGTVGFETKQPALPRKASINATQHIYISASPNYSVAEIMARLCRAKVAFFFSFYL
jgi:hypothetical protein